ncbi:MAG TPA: glycosyltransferase family A protein [Gemmatimonadales bacterium]|nr:glycosyltransferase family A protein [Gemmatimonadales bacterium]
MSQPERLRVSVVVVTKDRPEMLGVLLASLVGQSLAPDEVLVVDNNSTRSYAPVWEEFRARLPLRMVVEHTPGIPAARNRGIAEAIGDVILFSDDDCRAEPDWVERMVRPFYLNPHIGAVGGEMLSEARAGSLVEQFCVGETLMRMGRSDEAAG